MTVTYGPFDYEEDGETAAAYTEDQGSILFRGGIGDGIACMPGDTDYSPSPSGDASGVVFAPGTAYARGFFSNIDAAETVAVDAADSSLRIDRLVARLDKSTNTFKPFVNKGTAGSATAPGLVRSGDTWDIDVGLAYRDTDGSLTVEDKRQFAPMRIVPVTSDNLPVSDGAAFEFNTDNGRMAYRNAAGSRKTLLENSGKVTLSPRWPSYWRPELDIVAFKVNGTVHLRISVERRTRSTNPGNPGASFPLIVVLPAGFRPPVIWQPTWWASGGPTGYANIRFDTGEVILAGGDPVDVGQIVHLSCSFPVDS